MMNWFRYSGYHGIKNTDVNTGKVTRAMFIQMIQKNKANKSILLPASSDTNRIIPDEVGNDIHEFYTEKSNNGTSK
ncbi:Uncharacterised protein [Weissella viridescens]|uniref:Uncharacterized protein n=1 Tax=Weissella viridescens TaxID=1629 RepID=A0A380P850_WEIVI|nr:Uncharacterised protein [Weissella viridescens]